MYKVIIIVHFWKPITREDLSYRLMNQRMEITLIKNS